MVDMRVVMHRELLVQRRLIKSREALFAKRQTSSAISTIVHCDVNNTASFTACITSSPARVLGIAISLSVCVSVCLSASVFRFWCILKLTSSLDVADKTARRAASRQTAKFKTVM